MRARPGLEGRKQTRTRKLVRRTLIPVLTLLSLDNLVGGTVPQESARTERAHRPLAIEQAYVAERDGHCWLVHPDGWPRMIAAFPASCTPR